jgi:hypothetical protein
MMGVTGVMKVWGLWISLDDGEEGMYMGTMEWWKMV